MFAEKSSSSLTLTGERLIFNYQTLTQRPTAASPPRPPGRHEHGMTGMRALNQPVSLPHGASAQSRMGRHYWIKATGDPATLPPSAVPPGTATGHLPQMSSVVTCRRCKGGYGSCVDGPYVRVVETSIISFTSSFLFARGCLLQRRGAPSHDKTQHTAQHSSRALALFPMGYHKAPSFTLADVVYKSEGRGYRGAHAGCACVRSSRCPASQPAIALHAGPTRRSLSLSLPLPSQSATPCWSSPTRRRESPL
jgi:hypothetical protein